MRVKDIFQGIADQMLLDFDQMAHINHHGERGKQREIAVSDFLSKYLPKKYSIGSGQILDRKGNISRQCDIVIYDALNSPLLLVKDGYRLFPIEAVFGVIEVKSVLDSGTLTEGVQNIQSVKKLEREEPVIGVVFAYRSRYKNEPKIEKVANALRRENKSIPAEERIDLVCVLSEGLLQNEFGDEDSLLCIMNAEPSILLLFLYLLIEILKQRNTSMPNLIGYASQGEIGLVKILSSTEKDD